MIPPATPIKYDDVSWHVNISEEDDNPDLTPAVHIGLFLGWAIASGLADMELEQMYPDEIRRFQEHSMTGTDVLVVCSDGKLTNNSLNDEGNMFATDYYESGDYYEDFVRVLGGSDASPGKDFWADYDKIKPVLDRAYSKWRIRAHS